MRVSKNISTNIKRLIMCAGQNKKGGPKGLDTVWLDPEYFVTTDGKRLFATRPDRRDDSFSANTFYNLEYVLGKKGSPVADDEGPHKSWRDVINGNPKDIWIYRVQLYVPAYVARLDKAKKNERTVCEIALGYDPEGKLSVSWGLLRTPVNAQWIYKTYLDLGLLAPYAGSNVHVYLPRQISDTRYAGPILISESAMAESPYELDSFLLAVPSSGAALETEIFAGLVDPGPQNLTLEF